jgi:hypothetical protein
MKRFKFVHFYTNFHLYLKNHRKSLFTKITHAHILMSTSDPVIKTQDMIQTLLVHFDTLITNGADRDKMIFAKMQLRNAGLVATEAIYKGKAAAEKEAQKQIL